MWAEKMWGPCSYFICAITQLLLTKKNHQGSLGRGELVFLSAVVVAFPKMGKKVRIRQVQETRMICDTKMSRILMILVSIPINLQLGTASNSYANSSEVGILLKDETKIVTTAQALTTTLIVFWL